uniref:TDP43_N domain-containing protein n=1 Tax=Strongyloides venezuelensis TaxID=75913 RepID=A0A0K0FEF9_STRVS
MSCSNGEYVEMEVGMPMPIGWACSLYFSDGVDYQVHELPSSKSGVDTGVWTPSIVRRLQEEKKEWENKEKKEEQIEEALISL